MSSWCTCSIPNLRPPAHRFLFPLKSHCWTLSSFSSSAAYWRASRSFPASVPGPPSGPVRS
jgi:hypothetical protein